MSLIPLSRANNISIMLTQFSNFRRGLQDIRRAVCAGELGPERLSLLLQVLCSDPGYHMSNCHLKGPPAGISCCLPSPQCRLCMCMEAHPNRDRPATQWPPCFLPHIRNT